MRFLLCAVLVLVPALARADEEDAKILAAQHKKHKLPAMAVVVANSKGVVALHVVGVRKAGTEVAVTRDDLFHLGSDTKAFTGLMIASLVEAGKLDYETPLAKHFPELADKMTPDLKAVTLTHLMTHRAGLPMNLPGEKPWGTVAGKESPRVQRYESFKLVVKEKLRSKPGEEYFYSNLGYVIATAIAERATDLSYDQLMTKHVFEPLGMKSAGFGAPGSAKKIDQPFGHDSKGEPMDPGPMADNPPVMSPSGRMHCTLTDWAKYAADQLNGSRGGKAILKAETYKTIQSSPFPGRFYTPGGWSGQKQLTGYFLGHDGSNTLHYAGAMIFLSQDYAFLVITNQGGEAARKAMEDARRAIVEKYLKV